MVIEEERQRQADAPGYWRLLNSGIDVVVNAIIQYGEDRTFPSGGCLLGLGLYGKFFWGQ